jgi:MFS family permease
VVIGYLPQRAEAAGADIGLFFTGDALALLVLRVPAGWLAGRIGSLPLVLAGLAVTGGSLSLLLVPATTLLLVLAGVGTGAGAALLIPTLFLELSNRSDATDRGSGFALLSVAFSGGIALGSIGIAPVFDRLGFELALTLGIGACGAAAVAALLDGALRHPPLAARPVRIVPE